MSRSSDIQDDDAAQAPSGGFGVAENASHAEQMQFTSFAIDDDQYGVDIMAVREIKGWSEVARLPKQPDYVCGVINLRGVIVPIVDLRRRFGQGQTEAAPSHVVIIVQIEQRLVGLLADRVLDIVSIDAAKIQPVPRISRSARIDFLSGIVTVDGALIALIDLQHLLALPEDDGELAAATPSNRVRPEAALPAST